MRPGASAPAKDVERSTNILNARIPVPRAGYRGSIPEWPAALIEPVEREMVRWIELWDRPQAEVWVQTGQERTVAALVRLEQRCDGNRVSRRCVAELHHLRHELGLTDGAIGAAEGGSGHMTGWATAIVRT